MKMFLLNTFALVGCGLIKIGMFCSMLWILFSPKVMWAYLLCWLVFPILFAIPKAIIEQRKKEGEYLERLLQHQ